MKRIYMILLKRKSFFLWLLIIFSCTENLDFNQVRAYVATPIYTSSLTYFTVLPAHFVDPTGTIVAQEISDVSDFKIFENIYIRNNVVKIDFDIEIKNEFDRGFTVKIDLLNSNNSSVYRFENLNISSRDLSFRHKEEIEIVANLAIKSTTKVRITIEIEQNTTPLSPKDLSEFEFKSSASVYIESSI